MNSFINTTGTMQKSSLKTALLLSDLAVTSCSACRRSRQVDDQAWQTGDIAMDLILFWYNTMQIRQTNKKSLVILK